MLSALKRGLESHHGLGISDEAVSAAVQLSARYINDRFLPDKAIDLLDEAASRVRIEGGRDRVVGREEVADVVSSWTGLPLAAITEDEGRRLLRLEGALHERVVGQDEAVGAVARAIRRSRVGLSGPAAARGQLPLPRALRRGQNGALPRAGGGGLRR